MARFLSVSAEDEVVPRKKDVHFALLREAEAVSHRLSKARSRDTVGTHLKPVSTPLPWVIVGDDCCWRVGGADEKAAKGSLMVLVTDYARVLSEP